MTELWECLKSVRAFLRAFLALKFGRLMKFSYLCIVNEKRRNLRPNFVTNFFWRADTCFPVKAQNDVDSETDEKIFVL